MEINVNKQMGNTSLEVTINEKDEKEALAKALIFAQPDICGLCKKENIVWNANKVTIREKRDDPKRPDHGIVVELCEVLNQQEQLVLAHIKMPEQIY